MTKRRRVLVLAYFFPPLGGAGVQRTLKFVSTSRALGWDATVVSTRSRVYGALDRVAAGGSSRLPRVSSEQPRCRWRATWGSCSTSLRLMRLRAWVIWPDGGLGWAPFAFLAALRAARRDRPDVLFSTSAPYGAHLVALLVARLTGMPWVADFRDEWAANPYLADQPRLLARAFGRGPSGRSRERAPGRGRRRLLRARRVSPADDPRRVEIVNGVDEADLAGERRLGHRATGSCSRMSGRSTTSRTRAPRSARARRRSPRAARSTASGVEVRLVGTIWIPRLRAAARDPRRDDRLRRARARHRRDARCDRAAALRAGSQPRAVWEAVRVPRLGPAGALPGAPGQPGQPARARVGRRRRRRPARRGGDRAGAARRSGGGGRRTACPTRSEVRRRALEQLLAPRDRGAAGARCWRRLRVAERLRVLVAGWLNSPHVGAWADARRRGAVTTSTSPGASRRGWPELELRVPSHRLAASRPPPLRAACAMSRALARVAPRVEPDLVHAHYLPEFGWMAARESLRPLICSAWGSDVLAVRRIDRRALAAGARRPRSSSSPTRRTSRARRGDAGRDVPVEVVRWGLDLEAFAPGDQAAARERSGARPRRPARRERSRLRPLYNPELAARGVRPRSRRASRREAAAQAPASRAHRARAAAIERLGLSDAVMVLGNVPAERLPDVYRAADVVVSIAVERQLAAQRLGGPRLRAAGRRLRPAVGARRARDGRPGAARPLDADDVAAAIERVLDDDEPRGASRGGRASACRRRARPRGLRRARRRALPLGRGGAA